jgi:hypothetical protein
MIFRCYPNQFFDVSNHILGNANNISVLNYQFVGEARKCAVLMITIIKVKVKLSLCLTKHHAMKMYRGMEV